MPMPKIHPSRKRKPKGISLPPEMLEQTQRYASYEDVPFSKVVFDALELFFKGIAKKAKYRGVFSSRKPK